MLFIVIFQVVTIIYEEQIASTFIRDACSSKNFVTT